MRFIRPELIPGWTSCLCVALAVAFAATADGDPDESLIQDLIQANDVAGLKAALGTQAVVEGRIRSAAWSKSGKVMNIEFEGPKETALLGAIFEKSRKKFDVAFSGDVAAALSGAKVRVRGKLEEYGGQSPKLKGHPQIILTMPASITIIEEAPKNAPTTAKSIFDED